MDNLNQQIQSKLALQIAQLSFDKASLEAQLEQLRQQNEELQSQIESSIVVSNSKRGGDE
ncbi:hypothetical protein KJR28_00865 [Streptococcus lutetiensis]|uniref:hypothetical protein n=1 Tax=Streptococcus lutetiensis TaxID=150055 RepID=UPI001BDAEE5C|nr:hypothetical protein [Streptococcus lutetiensis]MBT0902871.1 hypothetical protein [Streptococcus lutetiensis]MBT0922295.1 hypothetical protein [Streptococcus lutetiensis]